MNLCYFPHPALTSVQQQAPPRQGLFGRTQASRIVTAAHFSLLAGSMDLVLSWCLLTVARRAL